MKYFIDSTVAINLRDGRGVPYTFINKIDFAKERVMISDYSLFELSGYSKRDLYPQFEQLLSQTNELYIATIYKKQTISIQRYVDSMALQVSEDNFRKELASSVSDYLADQYQSIIVGALFLNAVTMFGLEGLRRESDSCREYVSKVKGELVFLGKAIFGAVKVEISDSILKKTYGKETASLVFGRYFFSCLDSFERECVGRIIIPKVKAGLGTCGTIESAISDWLERYPARLKRGAVSLVEATESMLGSCMEETQLEKALPKDELPQDLGDIKKSLEDAFVYARKSFNKGFDFLAVLDRSIYRKIVAKEKIDQNSFVDAYNLQDFCSNWEPGDLYLTDDKEQKNELIKGSRQKELADTIGFYEKELLF
jgi:hypothetical protein